MMAEQSACECHYGNDMKLERKQSGLAQTNKKNQNKERGRKPNVQKHNATHIKINIEASDYFSAQLNSNAMNSNIIYK